MIPPTAAEIREGHHAFRERESRDAIYRVATFLIEHYWGEPARIADALGILLLTWNNAFYRYGGFDFAELERCVDRNQLLIDAFRRRNILDYTDADDGAIRALFSDFLAALRVTRAGMTRRSPVAVAKALHLLAPSFFPIWDKKIAVKYSCDYTRNPEASYLRFMYLTRGLARTFSAAGGRDQGGTTVVKLIDEYNYAKHTQGWV